MNRKEDFQGNRDGGERVHPLDLEVGIIKINKYAYFYKVINIASQEHMLYRLRQS